jgi:hypothetical protein
MKEKQQNPHIIQRKKLPKALPIKTIKNKKKQTNNLISEILDMNWESEFISCLYVPHSQRDFPIIFFLKHK